MKLTVNNLKKLVKKVLRPEETSPKEKDTLEGAVKKAKRKPAIILQRSFGKGMPVFGKTGR